MGQATLTWLSPILVALISGVVAYLVAARKTSGRIRDTDATKLWDEASSLRDVYQAEIMRLRSEIAEERAQREALEERNRTLQVEVIRLTARVTELENGHARAAG